MLSGLIIDGGEHPGVLDHLGDLRRKGRRPGVAGLEALNRAGQVGSKPVGIHLEVSKDLIQIRIGEIYELEQEMLDVHLVMGVGHA